MTCRLPIALCAGLGALAIGCGSSAASGGGAHEVDGGHGSGNVLPGQGEGGGAADGGGTGDDAAAGLDGTADDADAGASDASACRSFQTDPTLATRRTACAFDAGALTSETVEDGTAARAAITHVIVLTHENRSLDHMYGTLGHGIEGFPSTYTNPTADGGTVPPYHLTTSCPADINHSPASTTSEWDNGKMDGFYETDGVGSLGYYEPADHPFYSWLVTTFAFSDRYFCSYMGETGHNRRFLYGASGTQTASNIFTEMNAAHVSWGNYYAGSQPIYNTYTFPTGTPQLHAYSAFVPALDAGTLPSVTYVDTPSDEHPAGSVHAGEAAVRDVLTHAFASPLWGHLAIFLNYDEGGGFFDHVAPPAACVPSSSSADAIYDREGFRVPLTVVSPYARKGYVSHVDHSHTSTLRFIELLFGLPAITARDANSDALLDMFNFDCPDFTTPPAIGPAPPSGC